MYGILAFHQTYIFQKLRMLSEIAIADPAAFTKLVETAKSALN